MYRYAITFLIVLLALFCLNNFSKVIYLPSENHCPRWIEAPPKYLILHTVGFSEEWVLKNYLSSKGNGGYKVSAHYYIPSNGNKIIQLVDPKNTAYHAGVSDWQGDASKFGFKGLNQISIGVEIGSDGTFLINGEDHYPYVFEKYTDEAIEKAIGICLRLMKKFDIKPENVLWHSDVSPFKLDENGVSVKKTDPGANFPAKLFASYGVGVWPVEHKISDFDKPCTMENLKSALLKIGYCFDPNDERQSMITAQAFIMHYAPDEIKWEDFKNQKDGLAWNGIISERIMILATNLAEGHIVKFN